MLKKGLFALLSFLFVGSAIAAEGGAFIEFNEYTKSCFYYLAMAIAAYGGTRAQSNAASVVFEGIARNPSASDKLFVPMILGLALMESLVIFCLASVFFG